MKLKQYQKNILSVSFITIGGFILFNLAFLLTALVTNTVISVPGMAQNAVAHFAGRILSLFIILLISWFVLRSGLKDIIKAAFMTMPLMVVLVMVGISFYNQSKLVIAGIGAVIISGVLFYLYKKKLSWLYYYSTFYVLVLALCIMLFNIDI